ncbi:hypothetical protein J3R82DRAFT_8502 [Butyriboletus roseoflavus]|nr:hypothetical protein J3R82DRAFT_8502 [Butyriboletus roseoflavus]
MPVKRRTVDRRDLFIYTLAGARHEGTPEGKFETVGGVRTYVATPTVDYPKDKVILYLPDVFGVDLTNSQLLADDFARNGFKVYAIDYLNGDPIPPDALNVSITLARTHISERFTTHLHPRGQEEGKFDLPSWLAKHGKDTTRPLLDKVIAALKEQGVTQFAATGYCFGGESPRLVKGVERTRWERDPLPGRYTFDLAFDNVIKVAVVAHPSLLEIPKDLYTGIPLLINSCEVDPMFSIEHQAQADAILGGGSKTSELYQREYFAGCQHGFAIRGDLSKPEVKAGKEVAFKATVEFFLKHL